MDNPWEAVLEWPANRYPKELRMKKFLLTAFALLYLAAGGAWAQTAGPLEDHHARRHSQKKHRKKGRKGRKGKRSKGDGAELESQIRDKDVRFNAKASLQ
jgi:Ni/Co efflux regulator RcnB